MKLLKAAFLFLALSLALPIQAARPGSFASIVNLTEQEQAEALQELKDKIVVFNAVASVSKPQDGVQLKSVALEGDYVVWSFEIDEEAVGASLEESIGPLEEANIRAREEVADSIREDIMANNEDDSLEIICIGADKGIKNTFTSKQTGKTLSTTVTPDQMVEVFFEVLAGTHLPE